MKLQYNIAIAILLIHCLCGTTDGQMRIVGGTTTTISQQPYVLALITGGKYFCAGSLISRRHGLTAAHCLCGKRAAAIVVIGGITDMRYRSSGQRRRVQRKWCPRAFNLKTKNMDVGVFKMAQPMVLGPNLAIIPLATTRARVGARIRVSGWGTTNESSKIGVNVLRTVTVPVVARASCSRRYAGFAQLTNTMICAGQGGQDACAGDSGAPAVFNGRQYGIVSFGRGCGRSAFPGVYTDVATVLPFIHRYLAR